MLTPKERLLEFAAKKKLFRASDAETKAQVSRVYLQRLAEEGKLVKPRADFIRSPETILPKHATFSNCRPCAARRAMPSVGSQVSRADDSKSV